LHSDDLTDVLDLLYPNLTEIKFQNNFIVLKKPNTLNLIDDNYIEKLVNIYPNLEELEIDDCSQLSSKGLEYIGQLQNLKYLKLNFPDYNYDIYKDDFRHFENLKNLEHLTLIRANISDKGLSYFIKNKNIKYLNLSDCTQIKDDSLQLITEHFQSLEALNLFNTQITDAGFENIENLKNLKWLYLDSCQNIRGKALELFENLGNLIYLDLALCHQLTNDDLKKISKLKKLKYLNLHGIDNLDDKTLNLIIENLPYLKHLSAAYCENITDDGFKNIKKLNKLEKLDIEDCRLLTHKVLDYISEVKGLKGLSARYCFIESCTEDERYQALAKLKNLKFLSLSTLAGEKGLITLASHLKNLEALRLNGLEAEELEAIMAFEKLKFLDFGDDQNLNQDILKVLLKALPELQDLYFRNDIDNDLLNYLEANGINVLVNNLDLFKGDFDFPSELPKNQ
jgi:hypothetical protein